MARTGRNGFSSCLFFGNFRIFRLTLPLCFLWPCLWGSGRRWGLPFGSSVSQHFFFHRPRRSAIQIRWGMWRALEMTPARCKSRSGTISAFSSYTKHRQKTYLYLCLFIRQLSGFLGRLPSCYMWTDHVCTIRCVVQVRSCRIIAKQFRSTMDPQRHQAWKLWSFA